MSYTPDEDELDFSDLAEDLANAAASAMSQPAQHGPDIIKVGDQLEGRYKITEFIDRGGMGQVYRAYDTAIETTVALKLVRVSNIANHEHRERRVKRVYREISTAREAGLRCGHILSIYDVASVPSGDLYIVMEYLDGHNLRDWLELHAPAEPQMVCQLAMQMAKALKALHSAGFIHRDIKPENIFALPGDGEVPFIKLIDFGIVKDLDAATMTATTASLGTLRYMAPEVYVRTAKITDRSDIFGLGVVLFEALAGFNPMPHEHNELVDTYTQGLPPIQSQLDEPIPTWLSELIDACLCIDATQRPSAVEILDQLSAAGMSEAAALQRPAQPTAEAAALQRPAQPPALPEAPSPLLSSASPQRPPQPPALPQAQAERASADMSEPNSADVVNALDAALVPRVEPAALHVQPPTPQPDERLALPLADHAPSYQLRTAPPTRSAWPMAIAVLIGLSLIAAAIVFTSSPPRGPAKVPHAQTASKPELTFTPRGPVDIDDFPAAPRSAPAPTVPSQAAVSKSAVTAPVSAAATSSSSTVAATKAAPKSKVKRRPSKRRARPRTKRSAARKGLAKSFAELRDDALAKAGPASAVPPTYEPIEYDDEGGPQFFEVATPKAKALKLPLGSKLQAKLVSGISSSKHTTVIARLTADVMVNGALVLAKGDVIKGRSSNDSSRVFIDFKQGTHAGTAIRFGGHAVTSGLPGLPATKKAIPKEERGSNVVARGALNTASGVAAGLGGGVAGQLVGDVAREGATEVRPDLRSRQPFVLTVPEGIRFTVVITGS